MVKPLQFGNMKLFWHISSIRLWNHSSKIFVQFLVRWLKNQNASVDCYMPTVRVRTILEFYIKVILLVKIKTRGLSRSLSMGANFISGILFLFSMHQHFLADVFSRYFYNVKNWNIFSLKSKVCLQMNVPL